MTQLFNLYVEASIAALEEVKLLKENPEFRNLLNEYRDGILLFTIMEKEVWNRASEDTAGLRAFYQQNKDRYKAGERVRARIFATPDKQFLEEIKKKVSGGDSLSKDDLKKFKSVQPGHNYERGDNRAVDKVSWAIGLYDVQVDETYYLVEIENLLPSGTKDFEEARAKVVADYQDKLEKSWLVELKLKYPVKVNNKGKKFVVSELTEK
jgi:peptidyl-prolyl cis-trans isomerase SurA